MAIEIRHISCDSMAIVLYVQYLSLTISKIFTVEMCTTLILTFRIRHRQSKYIRDFVFADNTNVYLLSPFPIYSLLTCAWPHDRHLCNRRPIRDGSVNVFFTSVTSLRHSLFKCFWRCPLERAKVTEICHSKADIIISRLMTIISNVYRVGHHLWEKLQIRIFDF